MKVSVDYLFFKCRACPFVKKSLGTNGSIDYGDYTCFGDYICSISKKVVEGNTIPIDCPLTKDEVGKIYKISEEVH